MAIMESDVGYGTLALDRTEALVEEFQCTEKEALQALDRTGNDFERARLFIKIRNKYLPCSGTLPRRAMQDTKLLSQDDRASSPPDSVKSLEVNTPADGDYSEAATPSTEDPVVDRTADQVEIGRSHSTTNGDEGDPHRKLVSIQELKENLSTITQQTGHLELAKYDEQEQKQREKPEAPEDQTEHIKDWDFNLPLLPWLGNLVPGVADEGNDFSSLALATAIQRHATPDIVLFYLRYYNPELVKAHINDEVEGFPALFYAIESCNEGLVRMLLEAGADPSACHNKSGVPVLAFAIVHGETSRADTTPIVALLLSYGASPQVIPSSIYTPYDHEPTMGSKPEDDRSIEGASLSTWCTDKARDRLTKAANITHRYYLERASKIKKPNKRRKQIAQLRNAERLLGVPYFIIGQSFATELLIQRLLAHLMMPSGRPLVLCFAGPSGHGKTELARQLGNLLSLDLEVVDCTIVNREMELFGPREPYVGAEKGSPVNNFLAEHSGKRCIVFFDEFEKTTREIHQALLLPFDNGEYSDRRNHDKIDCSNTIWIIATNALDSTILDFCQHNDAIFGDDELKRAVLVKQLLRQLQEGFLHQFDAPITGRISEFVPFLPFSAGEQAVITHKALLELARDLRRPINLSKGPQEQLVGNIRLCIRKDATVCTTLAQAHYHRKLGARSLKSGAKKVERIVLDAYLDEDEEIQEQGGLRDFIIDVHGDEIIGHIGSVAA